MATGEEAKEEAEENIEKKREQLANLESAAMTCGVISGASFVIAAVAGLICVPVSHAVGAVGFGADWISGGMALNLDEAARQLRYSLEWELREAEEC